MTDAPARPVAPHLGIWKWGPHMAVSIINRVMGIGLATVGLVGFTWWLLSVSGGAGDYASFKECADSWFGLVVKIGLTWAFFQHLAGGIRHFVLDIGAGYELTGNRTGAIFAFIIPVLLTAAVWLYLFYVKG